jgi:hypothetical protein
MVYLQIFGLHKLNHINMLIQLLILSVWFSFVIVLYQAIITIFLLLYKIDFFKLIFILFAK